MSVFKMINTDRDKFASQERTGKGRKQNGIQEHWVSSPLNGVLIGKEIWVKAYPLQLTLKEQNTGFKDEALTLLQYLDYFLKH